MDRFRKPITIAIICLSAIYFNSCKPKPKAVLTAEFSLSKSFFSVGDTVRFTNDSKNFTRVSWDFGDGTTSEETNPVHIYTKAGIFTPKIKAYSDKEPKEFAKKIRVSEANPTIVIPDSITVGKEVLFKTTGTEKFNWKIDTSVVANNSEQLSQVFKKEGSYKIEIVNTATATSVDKKDIIVLALKAKAEAAKVEPPKKTASIVNFPATAYAGDMIDYSTNSKDPVAWDFGGRDKSETSSGKVSFSDVGKYVVKLMDKATGNVLDSKTINIIEKFDDSKFSSWLTDLANSKMSRSDKTELSRKVYGYCLNDGEIPVGGLESGLFKDFVRKVMIEANNYETMTIEVTTVINPVSKKITSVQVNKYDKKSNN